jgi:hypothetical protein
MKGHVNFLKELDDRWDTLIEETAVEYEVKSYKELN